ncbi:hypothetical protein ACH5RR_027004 [Cinchona calisaya]|uniref:Uncharacterized protein n=1 Tax=Cinchona calisaya TaxID=153742 RepID=A0ABD2Z474_9GENT
MAEANNLKMSNEISIIAAEFEDIIHGMTAKDVITEVAGCLFFKLAVSCIDFNLEWCTRRKFGLIDKNCLIKSKVTTVWNTKMAMESQSSEVKEVVRDDFVVAKIQESNNKEVKNYVSNEAMVCYTGKKILEDNYFAIMNNMVEDETDLDRILSKESEK